MSRNFHGFLEASRQNELRRSFNFYRLFRARRNLLQYRNFRVAAEGVLDRNRSLFVFPTATQTVRGASLANMHVAEKVGLGLGSNGRQHGEQRKRESYTWAI
jgi:hypothetical protein